MAHLTLSEVDNTYLDPEEVVKVAGYKARLRLQRYILRTLGDMRGYPAHLILQWESVGTKRLLQLQNLVYEKYAAQGLGHEVQDSPLFDGWMPGVEMLTRPAHEVMGLGEFRARNNVKIARNVGNFLDDLQRADKAAPDIREWDVRVPYQEFPGERANVARLLARMHSEKFKNWGELRCSSLTELLALDGIRSPETVIALAELGRRHYLIYDSLELAEPSPLFVTVRQWLASSPA